MSTNSIKAGILLFVWSFCGGLLGSLTSFLIGRLWHYWYIASNPQIFDNLHVSGLSLGLAILAVFNIRIFFCFVGAIVGAAISGNWSLISGSIV